MGSNELKRRAFLKTPGLALAASAQISPKPDVPSAAKDVTRTLARYVVNARYQDLPAPVRKEATRTLLNWVGCAVGGSHHETLDIAVAALGLRANRLRGAELRNWDCGRNA